VLFESFWTGDLPVVRIQASLLQVRKVRIFAASLRTSDRLFVSAFSGCLVFLGGFGPPPLEDPLGPMRRGENSFSNTSEVLLGFGICLSPPYESH